MTDEERKQFINEYCRNVGNIKIKCDDCKFKDECADYGWEGCRKFTPTPKQPQTNEEWFIGLPTEEKASFLNYVTTACYHCGMFDDNEKCPFGRCVDGEADFEMWLREKHNAE